MQFTKEKLKWGDSMLADAKYCTGCSACYNVCPKDAIIMKGDTHGFLHPIIQDSLCIQCKKCQTVCPPLNLSKSVRNKPIVVYAAQHISKRVLNQSTSGGVFTAISDAILDEKGVVYGAIHDKEMYTQHFRAVNSLERDRMCGAKYVQSEIGLMYREVLCDLKAGRKVLFTGTPCQIDGLRHFLPEESIRENLFLVDLICAGVPSSMVFRDYIHYYEKKKGKKILEHFHRSKKKGWGPHVEVTRFQDGSEDWRSAISQGWANLFHSGCYNRKSCYICPYLSEERVSDITIGDFWRYKDAGIHLPHKDGLSLVLINTKKGYEIFEKVKKDLIIEKSTIGQALIGQPRLRGIPCSSEGTEEAWNQYLTNGADSIMRRYADFNLELWIKRKGKKLFSRMQVKMRK